MRGQESDLRVHITLPPNGERVDRLWGSNGAIIALTFKAIYDT